MNKSQVAERLKITLQVFCSWVQAGLLPRADIEGERKDFYSAQQAERAKAIWQDFCTNYFNIVAIAKRAGVPEQWFRTCISSGILPQPTHRIGRRRYYHTDELPELVKTIKSRQEQDGKRTAGDRCAAKLQNRHDKRRAKGFYSKRELGLAAKLATTVVDYHIQEQHIQPPAFQLKTFVGRYYDQKTFDRALKILNKGAGNAFRVAGEKRKNRKAG